MKLLDKCISLVDYSLRQGSLPKRLSDPTMHASHSGSGTSKTNSLGSSTSK